MAETTATHGPHYIIHVSSAPSEPSGSQGETAASAEPPGDASCSSDPSSSSVQSSDAGPSDRATSAPMERSEPDGTEDTSGGCRRAEPSGEEEEESHCPPGRGHQDSDDSDDDPILIPPTRFRGQGQRYSRHQLVLIEIVTSYFSFIILCPALELTVLPQI